MAVKEQRGSFAATNALCMQDCTLHVGARLGHGTRNQSSSKISMMRCYVVPDGQQVCTPLNESNSIEHPSGLNL